MPPDLAADLAADLPAGAFQAALPLDALARLARLTRDYARLAQAQTGLPSALAGAFLILVALVEWAGHHGRLTWFGALAPLPLPTVLAVATLPILWLASRAGLHQWRVQRFGLVRPPAAPLEPAQARVARMRTVVGRFLLPGLMLLGLGPILAGPAGSRWLRAEVLAALAVALHLSFPRLHGRLERAAGILLFLAPAFLLAGIQMVVGDTLLAYPLIGAAAMVRGLRDHAAFRKVRRELAALQGQE